jgi:hypothetical protein
MRRWFTVCVVALAMLPALPAAAATTEPWVFEGGGWGHGVGLSQYGSQALALAGKDADFIIDFYYSGAQVKTLAEIGPDQAEPWLTGDNAIWVGLASNLTSRTFTAIGNGITVCQTGDDSDCPDTDLTLDDGDILQVDVVGTDPLICERMVNGDEGTKVQGDCWFDIDLQNDDTSIRIHQGVQDYARGIMRIRPNSASGDHSVGTEFHVSVSLQLQDYLYGISETLLHWKPAALQTQAIVARSYAVRQMLDHVKPDDELSDNRKVSCWCHIGSTSTDQNYDGWDSDNEGNATYGSAWRSAVNDSEDKVVTHPEVTPENRILSTYYSSSNGGASENVEDVFGSSPVPYLKSVDDPWSADPSVNPLATWSVKVSDDNMATYFGWDRVLDAFILQGPPGVLVKFTGVDGGADVSSTLNGTQIRALLNALGFGYSAPGVSSTTVRVSPYITTVTDPPGFDDIVGNTFELDIEWLANEGVTKGCNPPDNTLFCPDQVVSREVMAAFLNRYLSLPAASKDYFTDDNGSVFEDDINRVAEAGITKGCGGTSFCPHDLVDRGQMAAFLVRSLGLTDNGGGDLFIDDDKSIFENDIDKLGTAGVTKGCNPPTNDRFCPGLPVDRGAMAAFLHRADGL